MLQFAPDDSPFVRALTECGHTAAEHLTLLTQHLLSVANWQRVGDKKIKPPRLPDCMLPEDQRATQKFGTASMPIEDMQAWLGWSSPPAAETGT